jgi:hypothetical protein
MISKFAFSFLKLGQYQYTPPSGSSTGKGYFGGGTTGSNSNVIDGIQYSDETAINPSATLSLARQAPTGASSSSKGYFGGGYASSDSNVIDGIQFSDETSINPSATLSVARYGMAGVSSSSKGYFAGGGGAPTGVYAHLSEIDGIEFSSEAAINPSASLSQGKYGCGSFSTQSRGYFGGGGLLPYADVDKIDRLEFASETLLQLSTTLSSTRRNLAGVSGATKGYFAGGGGGQSAYSNEIDGIRFSDETAINPSSALSSTKMMLTGVSSVIKGYFGGGYTGVNIDVIDVIQFSDETAINPSATLSLARRALAGIQSQSTIESIVTGVGYIGRGYDGTNVDLTIDKYTYATDTSSVSSATCSVSGWNPGEAFSATDGYFAGGTNSVSPINYYINSLDGINFSTESAINPAMTLATGRQLAAGTQSDTKGYFIGGANGSSGTLQSEIDGILFSSETLVNPTSSLYGWGFSATENDYFAYVAGGLRPSINANTINKFTFSIEGISTIGSVLSVGSRAGQGISSSDIGYHLLGYSGSVLFTVDRILYATDTKDTSINCLTEVVRSASSESSSKGGIFGGNTGVTAISQIQLLDFNAESFSNSASTLSVARDGCKGLSYYS